MPSYIITVISESTAMGDELKWLLKEGGGLIFVCFDISLENRPTYCRYMQTLCSSCMCAQVGLLNNP